MAYTLPQIEVFQVFNQLPTAVTKNMNAFIFGPHYQLFRYAVSAEKAMTGLGQYNNGADTTYAWPNQPTASIVDPAYVKLYAENVWAQYLNIPGTSDYEAQIPSESDRNQIRVNAYVLATANSFQRSAALLRNVRVGDCLRYSYTDSYDTTYTGTTKIAGLLADEVPYTVADAVTKASNKATTTATTGLGSGNSSVYAAATSNAHKYDGSKVWTLAGAPTASFPGNMAAGVVGDTITVTITTYGAPGTAMATVSYASGTYTRDNVLIEADNGNGSIYIGNNMYVAFAKVSAVVNFVVGDVYTVAVDAPFTAVTGEELVTSGSFSGAKNTTYIATVTRGGLFSRAVNCMRGVTNTQGSNAVLAVKPGNVVTADWSSWLGGDINDEYLITCTTAGTIANALFSLISTSGDDQTGISFVSSGHSVTLGVRGLVGAITLSNTATPFAVGDSFVVRVNACRPQIKISDTAGIDASSTVTVDYSTEIDLGNYGVQLMFDSNSNTEASSSTGGGLMLGDVFYVAATGAAKGAVHTMVLSDDVNAGIPAGVNIELWLHSVQNSVSIGSARTQYTGQYNWTADITDGITVDSGMEVQDPSWVDAQGNIPYLPVYAANLFVQYRALLTEYADTIHSISDISDVAITLGTVTPDNPLAQGVNNALENSGSSAVYFMAIPTSDATGWAKVLRATENNRLGYSFAPMTQDKTVIDTTIANVMANSDPTVKQWRIAVVGSKLPTEKAVYTSVADPSGNDFLAEISLDSSTGANTLLTFVDADGNPSAITKALADLVTGDEIHIGFSSDSWGNVTYSTYFVAAVLTNSRVRLTAGPATAMDQLTKVEAYHPYTLDEMATAYAAISTGFYNRRVYNVFPPEISSDGVVQTSEFEAAALAGLISSVPPQQPLTNIEVSGFDDAPMCYQTFSRAQLNTIAAGGTLILMQDSPGSTVYVRHQISTAASSGDLNQSELSITKNFDSISYYFADRFAPYYGKSNVTPALLNAINLILKDGINYLASLTNVGLIGPQVDLATTEIVSVAQSATLKDRVVAVVNVGMPAPFNVFALSLVAV